MKPKKLKVCLSHFEDTLDERVAYALFLSKELSAIARPAIKHTANKKRANRAICKILVDAINELQVIDS
jgi:hypothetical protein